MYSLLRYHMRKINVNTLNVFRFYQIQNTNNLNKFLTIQFFDFSILETLQFFMFILRFLGVNIFILILSKHFNVNYHVKNN